MCWQSVAYIIPPTVIQKRTCDSTRPCFCSSCFMPLAFWNQWSNVVCIVSCLPCTLCCLPCIACRVQGLMMLLRECLTNAFDSPVERCSPAIAIRWGLPMEQVGEGNDQTIKLTNRSKHESDSPLTDRLPEYMIRRLAYSVPRVGGVGWWVALQIELATSLTNLIGNECDSLNWHRDKKKNRKQKRV